MNGYRGNEYWNMVRISNEDKEYPSNMGQKWTDEEEALLLEELYNNIDIETIAQKHNRTIGGIESRRREIAYKMYLKKMSNCEIIKKTKLDYDSIKQTIEKRQKNNSKRQTTKEIDNLLITFNKNDYLELQNDVKKMKNDIYDIKNKLGELVEMMKALYEFEDA
jgi:ABC-type lipopolysaccharide export system ATPase subunit